MDYQYLKHSGIIHMNGRVYDPGLGRMLSPDPVTQAPENGQNYNRYTYAFNNPLRYTDPSGFQIEEVLVRPSGSSGCCYADWDGGYQPYSGKGSHALDLLFGARIHYNMTEGLRLKLAPGFEKHGLEVGDWLGLAAALGFDTEGDNVSDDGTVIEEVVVTGQKPPVIAGGVSGDFFIGGGGGFDAGLYYDYQTGEFGYFGDIHFGAGWDVGLGLTIQLTDDPENLDGDFVEGELSPSGLLEVNQNTTGVTSVNLNLGNPGPSGHVSSGSGVKGCIVCVNSSREDLR